MKKIIPFLFLAMISLTFFSCEGKKKSFAKRTPIQEKLDDYAIVKLSADISKLNENERSVLKLLIEAAEIMDDIFWEETYGDQVSFLKSIPDKDVKAFALINYGPWERLKDNQSFIKTFKDKPLGTNYYPQDITEDEFNKFADKNKTSPFTMICRKQDRSLEAIPYYQIFSEKVNKASSLLNKAGEMTEDKEFGTYLKLRAEALLNDKYDKSDIAWTGLRKNKVDIIIGPIEFYDDALYGYKASHQAYILYRDSAWSTRLSKLAALLPALQDQLPFPSEFKKEIPKAEDIGVYDALYYSGLCNSGSKPIAILLPNNEKVRQEFGYRNLIIKNVLKAKYDSILVPISDNLIDLEQNKDVTFNAFFLGIVNQKLANILGVTPDSKSKGEIINSLKEHNVVIEECKAYLLGLYMVAQQYKNNEIKQEELMSHYVSFLANIFRSVRFGAAKVSGKSNMLIFNSFHEMGAIVRTSEGRYKVIPERIPEAMDVLYKRILVIQANRDYEGVKKLMSQSAVIRLELQNDLKVLTSKNIPVDVVFQQGKDVLGL